MLVLPVGFNNHPNFLSFVASLVLGIVAFDVLTVTCKSQSFRDRATISLTVLHDARGRLFRKWTPLSIRPVAIHYVLPNTTVRLRRFSSVTIPPRSGNMVVSSVDLDDDTPGKPSMASCTSNDDLGSQQPWTLWLHGRERRHKSS